MISLSALVARGLLLAMFVSAVSLHLRKPEHMMRVLKSLSLPLWLFILLAVSEAALAVGLVLTSLAAIPAVIYVTVVSMPTIAAVRGGAQRLDEPCGCYEGPFGNAAGRVLLRRNLVVAILGIVVALAGGDLPGSFELQVIAVSTGAAGLLAGLRFRSGLRALERDRQGYMGARSVESQRVQASTYR
jgi:hypothetical protein